ncbi:MAG: amino acid adenylation domain-containing protein [Wenzhouxiangellaceae bacterium]
MESQLTAQPGVQDALAQVLEGDLGRQLVAHVVADEAVEEAALKEKLRASLPAYMVPLAIIRVNAFPLTANGKVDRDALPTPDWAVYRQQFVAPRNEPEEKLAAIYRDLLRIDEVGIDDDFFALGGHSLLVTRLVSRIRSELSVEVPLRAAFEQSTIRALAASLPDYEQSIVLLPITVANRDQILPLSFAQQRLWFIDQLEGGSAQYNMPMAYRFSGEFDRGAFEGAIRTIMERHEALRTSFVEQDGHTFQLIRECGEAPVTFLDLSAFPESEREHHVQQMTRADARAPFDLGRDVLLRVTVLKLDHNTHVVLANMHHIASDGWSMGIFFRELGILYRAYRRSEPNPLSPLPIQYAGYARWQREWLQGEVLERQLDYWRQQLAASPPVHNLPLDRQRPPVQGFNGQMHRYGLKGKIVGALKQLCQTHDVTLFMLLQTAFALLVARYSNEQDVVMGTPIAGRTHGDTENLIGFFVNTLALRTWVDGRESFADLLAANKQMIVDAFTHQHIPFEMLVEQLQPERSLQYSPLFQIVFALQNNDGGGSGEGGLELDGLSFSPVERESSVIKFDLELIARETDDMLVFGWNYNSDVFDRSTIERLAAGYNHLLQAIVADCSQPAGALPVIAEDELQRMERWNRTDVTPAAATFVQQLFEARVAANPEAVAVISGESRLHYGELNARANRLARDLRSRGIGAEDRVGVCMARGVELAVAMLAIIKAGGAYVPLDPTYPRERLAYMAANAGVRLVLSNGDIAIARELDIETLDLDGDGVCPAEFSDANLAPVGNGDSLAYVIYTSGSTGQPKGVANTHRGLLNLVHWHIQAHQVRPEHRASMLANIGFDAATWELWPYLSAGASLVTVTDEQRLNPQQLLAVLNRHRVSHCFMPTPLAEQVGDDWPETSTVQVLLVGGDRLNRHCLPVGAATRLVNHYGPTETAVVATWRNVAPDDRSAPPIGRPIDNARAYILDGDGRRVPCGVVGELYIGGLGLARGYFGRAAVTALSFVPDPFSDQPGARAYRTGDLCRYLPDGEIEYVGRIDHQVKIRGFRIELGEVESQLTAQPGVQDALAQVLEGDLGRQLVAHVVTNDTVEEAALKEKLRASLPAYMVPLAIIRVDAFPLTANGKVDRRALPAPEWAQYKRKYTAPRSATEVCLVEAFQAVLPVEPVGIDDDFFALGGHSLLAVSLVGLLKERGIVIKVKDLFAKPTVRTLAQGLDADEAGQETASGHSLTALGEHAPDLPDLYCVPGIGGLSSSFIELASAGRGMFNVHAFEHRGVTGDDQPHGEMTAIVDEFVKDLLNNDEQGPFCLAGHSFGGCVAFEMATALQAAGHRVRVILLDSLLFPNLMSDTTDKRASEEILDVDQIRQALQQGRPNSMKDAEIDAFAERLAQVYRQHYTINRTYRPGSGINGDLLLLHARESNPFMRGEEYLEALRGLTLSRVQRGDVPGGHLSMLSGDSATALAQHINAFINGREVAGS